MHMMKNIQKAGSLLLVIVFLMSLAACGETAAETEPVETAADTVAVEETEPELKDNLPDLDYAGADMRVLHFGSESATLKDALGDDAGGDIVSDAVYNRNLMVEDRLNIKFTWTPGSSDWGGYPNEVANMILGGDCPYEMVFMESSQCFRLSLEGYFQDLMDLPYVELEQPWWYTDFMNGGSIGTDHRYYLTGAFSITTMEGASAVVVNKALFNDNFGDYNDLYDLVKENAWTYDRFAEYCAGVYNDINGNGEKDEDDIVGFANQGQRTINYLSMSTGLPYMQRDENGIPQLDLYNDYAIQWVDTLYNLLYTENYAYQPKDPNAYDGTPHFAEGKALFMPGLLSGYTSTKLRDMEDPKGVVPHPVLEEGMKYVSAAGTVNGESVVIPSTTPAELREMCGATMEALSFEAYRLVVPAWYEVALKSKYADAERDAEMIDVIYDTIDTSFIMMADKLLGSGSFFYTVVGAGKIDGGGYTSYYEKNIKALQTKWDNMLAAYEELISQ